MITLCQIEKAVTSLLKEKFKIPTYSNEVLEGFKTPCFFTLCKFTSIETMRENSFFVTASVTIMFLPSSEQMKRVRSESLNLKMASALCEVVLPNIKVEDRVLTVKKLSTDFSGENGDILLFGIDLEYYDAIKPEENDSENLIEEIFINEKID